MNAHAPLAAKPRRSSREPWNFSFGFFGIRIGFTLQDANMSRILRSLGTAVDDLPALRVAASLTGFVVQPVIRHPSDRA